MQMNKSITCSKDRASASLTVRTPTTPHCKRLIFHPHDWCQTFPFQQFQALFNSLFKVLFIFPSRYLFAIGLSPIFSLRRDLPPVLGCIPRQPDSWKVPREVAKPRTDGGCPLSVATFQCIWVPAGTECS